MKPVQRIDLPDEHNGLKITAAVLLVILAAGFIGYGVYHLLNKETGWTTIEAEVVAEKNGCQEMVLQYDLSADGGMAAPEHRKLAKDYANFCGEGYRMFSSAEEFPDTHNLWYINRHPNEDIAVDPALYRAFQLMEERGGRYLYLAPVYEQYEALFSCLQDWEADEFDPRTNEVVMDFIRETIPYTENEISLVLLGGDTVRLNVSESYLRYAEEQYITSFIDFFMLRNAFVVDYTAERLMEEGYSHGILTSYDGFTRHLGEIAIPMTSNIFDGSCGTDRVAAHLTRENGINMVYMRNYAVSNLDTLHYYEWADGRKGTPYIDLNDGLCRAAAGDLLAYSKASCAEIALTAFPLYTGDAIDEAKILAAAENGVEFVYSVDHTVFYTEEGADIDDLYRGDDVTYTKALLR